MRLWQLAARQARRPWLSVSLSVRPNHAHLRQRYGGAVVTETVFSLPGVGLLLTDSILGKDLPTVERRLLWKLDREFLAAGAIDKDAIRKIPYPPLRAPQLSRRLVDSLPVPT